jgi:hypothetical protein
MHALAFDRLLLFPVAVAEIDEGARPEIQLTVAFAVTDGCGRQAFEAGSHPASVLARPATDAAREINKHGRRVFRVRL